MIAERQLLQPPNRETIAAFLCFVFIYSSLFSLAYFGPQLSPSSTQTLHHFYFDWETAIPLIPWMIWPYLSLFILFVLPLFFMGSREIVQLTRQSVFCLTIAAFSFYLFPCSSGFPQSNFDAIHKVIFDWLYSVDVAQNMLPSLHIVVSTLILLGAADVTKDRWVQYFFYSWLVVITASVFLVHQHHIIDVIAGFSLAAICRYLMPLKNLNQKASCSSDLK